MASGKYGIQCQFIKTRYNCDAIFVVIDKHMKLGHFIPRNTIDDAFTLSNKYVKEIFTLHGFLEVIILDRDNKFTS